MSILVEHPGAHTTVQDLGRPGQRSAGVPLGGAVDPLALRVANWLVGNDENTAALECLLVGPRLRFRRHALLALCGARAAGVPHWQAFEVRAGEMLELSKLENGAAAYLAVAGGIDVPPILGSRSTDTRLGWGGVNGRALRAGDRLKTGAVKSVEPAGQWRVNFADWYPIGDPLRIVRGAQWSEFASNWSHRRFKVTARSDRMAIRLRGEALERSRNEDLPSSPVCPGTIQVPPDGQPIVLLADAQTLGGYPKIGHVISVDLPRAAQLRPGELVYFEEVSIQRAHELQHQRGRELALLGQGIADKLKA